MPLSLFPNAWEGYALNARFDRTGLTVAVVIAASSALQAGVAGTSLRRALGDPVALDNARDLGRFVLLCPLCCLSATLSLCGMWTLGALRESEFASSWITWWVGDTLGVLLMLPSRSSLRASRRRCGATASFL
jgi:integral membrane sensor domain MASE1